jgi:hypothetical protein
MNLVFFAATITLCVCWGATYADDSFYIIGNQGDTCAAACGSVGRTCLSVVNTDNSSSIFEVKLYIYNFFK